VELVPAPWTAPQVVARTEELMRRVGQVPIRLNREIAGFVVNRLQSAVLAEAFRLVEDGICAVPAVDAAMADGLGLRWFFMGPFETIDLNAQGGLADYCAKLGPMYSTLPRSRPTRACGAPLWSRPSRRNGAKFCPRASSTRAKPGATAAWPPWSKPSERYTATRAADRDTHLNEKDGSFCEQKVAKRLC
jgi:3-hydroxyacyl-CoA dehydrogenase